MPGPPGENLAAAALRAFRRGTGWEAPPLRLKIAKRIPVAAGLGGGSADAAAALRLARHASGLGDEALLRDLGAELGADVPAQVSPGRWLATGAGERLQRLPDPNPASFGLLLLPLAAELSTAAVYAEADRLGLARTREELEDRRRALERLRRSSAGRADRRRRASCCTTISSKPPSRCVRRSPPRSTQAREAGAQTRWSAARARRWWGCSRERRTARRAARHRARARRPGGPAAPRRAPVVARSPVDAAVRGARPHACVTIPAGALNEQDSNQRPGGRLCRRRSALALYAGLILVPAWTAYSRLWQRLAATVLSLYVLVMLVGLGCSRGARRRLLLGLARVSDFAALDAITEAVESGAGLPEVVRAAGRRSRPAWR